MGVNINRIKAYRVLNDLGQQYMAERMGISLASYCHKERGYKDFSSKEVAKMAEIFKVPTGDLFSQDKQLL